MARRNEEYVPILNRLPKLGGERQPVEDKREFSDEPVADEFTFVGPNETPYILWRDSNNEIVTDTDGMPQYRALRTADDYEKLERYSNHDVGHLVDTKDDDDIEQELTLVRNARQGLTQVAAELDEKLTALEEERRRRAQEAEECRRQLEQEATYAALAEVMNRKKNGGVQAGNAQTAAPATTPALPRIPSRGPVAKQEATALPAFKNAGEIQNTSKKITRKAALRMGSLAAVVASVGAGAVYGPNLFKGEDHAAAGSESVAAAELSEADIDIASCFDDDGTGEALFTEKINFTEGVNWPVELKTKKIIYPKKTKDTPLSVMAEGASVDYAACVPDADRGAFLEVNSQKVVIDFSKVTPQVSVAGYGETPFVMDQLALSEKKDSKGKIVLDKKGIDAAVKNATNEKNHEQVVNSAAADVAAVITKTDSEYAAAAAERYKAQLISAAKEDVAAYFKELGQPVPNLVVESKNELPKEFVSKTPDPKKSDAVSVDERTLEITKFTLTEKKK